MSELSRVSDVLRPRRHHPTRLEGFFDAAFAFAVTLVVISIGHAPHSVPEMLQAMRGIPAFALCYMLLVRIWRSHRDWSRRYDLEDDTSIRLSMVLLFLVLVYAYPLRLLFTAAVASVSGQWMVDEAVEFHSYDELRTAFIVFGLGHAAIWIVLGLLHRHALAAAAKIGLNPAEQQATQYLTVLSFAFAMLGLLSALLATVLPFDTQQWTIWVAGLIYATSGFIAAFLSKRYKRRIEALPATA